MAAAAALALAGCAKENQPDTIPVQDNAAEAAGKTITFEASLGTDAKTTLGDLADGKRPVYWESADKLAAVVGSSVVYSDLAVEADDENKKKCTFSIVGMTEPSETDNLIFFYPSQGASATEGGVQFTLSSLQIGPADGLPKTSGSYNPLAAAVADAGNALDVYENGGSSVTFRNVFGLLAFQFPSADIKQVVFEGNDNETVAGTYVITAGGALTDATSVSKSVTLKTSDGNAFKTGYTYYMAVAPQDFEKGFTLTFTTTDGLTYQKTTDNPLELAASDIISLGEFKNGISSIHRVWGKYSSSSSWYASPVSAIGGIRNISMDDDYIYLAAAGGPGVYVINRQNGSFVKSLSTTNISGGSYNFHTSDINVINSVSGSKLLVCNMVTGINTELKVYSYDSVESDPKVVLTYKLPAAYRFGDKFTIEGTWESGKLYFYDYSLKKAIASFSIIDGVIESTPKYITIPETLGAIGGIYKFGESEYLYAGTQQTMYALTVSGNNATVDYHLYDTSKYSANIPGACIYSFNSKNYLSYIGIITNGGSMNVCELKSNSLKESLKVLANNFSYNLAGENSSDKGESNGNGCGDIDVRVINGKTYIAAFVTGSGLSLFELK